MGKKINQPQKELNSSMEVLVFFTSLSGHNDLRRIAKKLDRIDNVIQWTVDMDDVDRVLRVLATSDVSDRVLAILNDYGYDCRKMPV